jgi:transcriptional repressor NrdR
MGRRAPWNLRNRHQKTSVIFFTPFCIQIGVSCRLTPQDVVLNGFHLHNFYDSMRCPKCGYQEDRVIDSRSSKDGASIRRRRECTKCLHRFTTYEAIERAALRVIKRDGRSEPFERNKLVAGISKACEKRPISLNSIEKAVEELQGDLESNHGREISSQLIGTKVMEKLHSLDEVAYVRYASVYRHFQDIGEFIDEIQSLERRAKPSVLQTELFQ